MDTVRRTGLLLPSSNTTMEPELYRMAPMDVTIHTARMMLGSVTPEGLEAMARDAIKAAKMLETAEVDLLLYGCTSGSLIKGLKWEAELVTELSDATGIPTVSTGRAVVEAMKELGLERVGVATPYIDEINDLEKEFLEGHGFEVARIVGLGITENPKIAKVNPERVMDLARSVSSGADGVFISCTNLPTIGVIEIIEADLGIPVVTSNQASMWAALKGLRLGGVEGYGTLMRNHLRS
jgi:maleate isomerase